MWLITYLLQAIIYTGAYLSSINKWCWINIVRNEVFCDFSQFDVWLLTNWTKKILLNFHM